MRKLALMLLALALIASPFIKSDQNVAQASQVFPDMPNYGQAEIKKLKEANILIGNPDGTLRPNENVSRAEAITMIGRALNLNGTQRQTPFPDVASNHYASGYVTSGFERGMITGTSAGLYEPSRDIKRLEMAVILTRAFNLTAQANTSYFYDVSPTRFGASEINAIARAGLTAGFPNGSFRPDHSTSRVDFAIFLARALYPEFKQSPPPQITITNLTRAEVFNAASGLNVRATPNTSQAAIGTLSNGTIVQYQATSNGWAQIMYNGRAAYVSLSYLRTPTAPSGGLAGKVLVVDPGHGGKDPGASSFGVREKDVVLAIGRKLKPKLEKAGATVIMTRETDIFLELSERVAIANNRNANAFISLHANAAGAASAHGTETYWNATNSSKESKELAEAIQKELINKLKTRDRGVKEGNFHVIRNSKMASVLVEVGFVTNQAEANKLASDAFQEDAAEAIYQGIVNFYK